MAIALVADEAVGRARRVHFPLQHVNLRLGKILQAASVIEIQVRQKNMPDVLRGETQLAYLLHCGEAALELDVVERHEEEAQALAWLQHVAAAKAGIDQHQAVLLGLDQQTMAHQTGGQSRTEAIEQTSSHRTHAAAVEVMNTHKTLPCRATGRRTKCDLVNVLRPDGALEFSPFGLRRRKRPRQNRDLAR